VWRYEKLEEMAANLERLEVNLHIHSQELEKKVQQKAGEKEQLDTSPRGQIKELDSEKKKM
jgi:phosphopantothenate synthetase